MSYFFHGEKLESAVLLLQVEKLLGRLVTEMAKLWKEESGMQEAVDNERKN